MPSRYARPLVRASELALTVPIRHMEARSRRGAARPLKSCSSDSHHKPGRWRAALARRVVICSRLNAGPPWEATPGDRPPRRREPAARHVHRRVADAGARDQKDDMTTPHVIVSVTAPCRFVPLSQEVFLAASVRRRQSTRTDAARCFQGTVFSAVDSYREPFIRKPASRSNTYAQ